MLSKLLEVHSLASGATRHYGSRYFANIIKIMRLRYADGHMLKDMKAMGLLSPKPGFFYGSTVIPSRVFVKWRDRGNPPENCPQVDCKPNFYRICQEIGIRVPEVYAIGLPSIDMLRNLPSSFLAKPVYGGGGFGVSAYDRKGTAYRSWDGQSYDKEALVRHLLETSGGREVIFQERLFPATSLESFIKAALPTFRIVTYLMDGKVTFLSFYLRVPAPGRLVDNIGCLDNGQSFIEMDLETGRALSVWRRDGSGWGLTSSQYVDAEERRPLDSIEIPYVDNAIKWAFRLAEANANLRSIGWDIGLSNQGPVAIEGNSGWGLPYIPTTMQQIRKVMGVSLDA